MTWCATCVRSLQYTACILSHSERFRLWVASRRPLLLLPRAAEPAAAVAARRASQRAVGQHGRRRDGRGRAALRELGNHRTALRRQTHRLTPKIRGRSVYQKERRVRTWLVGRHIQPDRSSPAQRRPPAPPPLEPPRTEEGRSNTAAGACKPPPRRPIDTPPVSDTATG